MRDAELGKLLDHVRRAAARREAEALPDGQLLQRFVSTGDESSFAALVARHGRMVFAVCRRVLRHEQDAEDAFQATFLVLARKARSLGRPSVAPWLHEVATRTALDARAVRARRRERECGSEHLPHPAVEPVEPQDWRAALDAELSRLPAKYRAAVVLCELEGKTRSEAAGLLGVPEGTLSSRLAKAKETLARRLARLAPAGALAAFFAAGTASATAPPALADSTIRLALLLSAGLEITAAPAALMKGVLTKMFLMKLKAASAVLFVVTALGAGGVAYQSTRPVSASAEPPAAPASAEALRKENELLKLNLQVVLEKVRAQEAELRALKGQTQKQAKSTGPGVPARVKAGDAPSPGGTAGEARPATPAAPSIRYPEVEPNFGAPRPGTTPVPLPAAKAEASDPLDAIEAAMKALRAAKGEEARRRAAEALDRAMNKYRERNPQQSRGEPVQPFGR